MKLASKLFYAAGAGTFFLVLGLASVYNLMPAANIEETVLLETTTPVLLVEEKAETTPKKLLSAEEQLIKLRLARERAWSEKMAVWEEIGQAENLLQDSESYFLEQQMEILLQAKGFRESMVLITEKRVNVLVPAAQAKESYQLLHDLVAGNLGIAPNSVYIIPIEEEI